LCILGSGRSDVFPQGNAICPENQAIIDMWLKAKPKWAFLGDLLLAIGTSEIIINASV
jgi:hypothetical protein